MLRISNSTITGNAAGVHTAVTASTESLGNNLIKGNGTNVVGTLDLVAAA